MDWDKVTSKVEPYIVKIDTPTGSGTGFLCVYNQEKTLCGLATALHVVNHANQWLQPIRLTQFPDINVRLLEEKDRMIFTNWENDSAVILFPKADLPFPEDLIPLFPANNTINIGIEVGWLGFPAIEPYTLCFFSGNISARREDRKAYLIDGVAINGVSGGPVLYPTKAEGVQIVGIVSAYRANRLGAESLPGLSIAQDVSHFHDVIQHIKSIDEAQKEKRKIEEQNPET